MEDGKVGEVTKKTEMKTLFLPFPPETFSLLKSEDRRAAA